MFPCPFRPTGAQTYPAADGPDKVAVRDLWFGVRRGECFGFLGMI